MEERERLLEDIELANQATARESRYEENLRKDRARELESQVRIMDIGNELSQRGKDNETCIIRKIQIIFEWLHVGPNSTWPLCV